MTAYFDLGAHTRAITTDSDDAQIWFDRGLNWIYGFNFDEAIFCFKEALKADPNCAMAHWGIGLAIGPDYNMHWDMYTPKMRAHAVKVFAEHQQALAQLRDQVTDVERGLIDALVAREVDVEAEDFTAQNDAYADAMRKVCAAYPNDLDVISLTAEALMVRTPWALWDLKAAKPTDGSSTQEAMDLLEQTFAEKPAAWSHPGCLHLYIHLMEMSPFPERALRHGDALTGLVPDAGHMQHMASHIDVLCGEYPNVVHRNQRAWDADKDFLELRGPDTFYTPYICHDLHFVVYGAMFLGQLAPALEASHQLENLLTPEVVEPNADWIESYYPMRYHALVRFGEWAAIDTADLPDDQELYCFSTGVALYAKGISAAVQGKVTAARDLQDQFEAAWAKVPEERMLFNNRCIDILEIANMMLEGEILYREKRYEDAFSTLRDAVQVDDNLPYEEPWGWMQPARHALGALLLEQGHAEEAEAVYRADLGLDPKLARACQNPNNVWSLKGLHTCLTRRGAADEAALIKPVLDRIAARADRDVTVSCFCANS